MKILIFEIILENGSKLILELKHYGDTANFILFSDGLYLCPLVGNPMKIRSIEIMK